MYLFENEKVFKSGTKKGQLFLEKGKTTLVDPTMFLRKAIFEV